MPVPSTAKDRAVRPVACELYFLPVQTRVPLKFGHETLSSVTCARVRMTVEDARGTRADGWGETPLSVQWAWPAELSYESRLSAMKGMCIGLADVWANSDIWGHPIEIAHEFEETMLEPFLKLGQMSKRGSIVPRLAALVCCSAFDIALHDAFGNLHGVGIYETYNNQWLSRDLAAFFGDRAFANRYPHEFLTPRADKLIAWHLVGGLDPISTDDLRGDEPDDGYPILLPDWIRRDGLRALKIKLCGNDRNWDIARLTRVGRIALDHNVHALSADFNCTASDPEYVNDVLDTLARDHRAIYDRLLYIEQPFPYDLEKHRIDVRSIASRKPIFLDESAHDWRMIALGRSLGWNGVALKTCKTQSGAILSLCWARAHGMQIMVQDLTNPMLAMIPHALLAANAGTIMGIETNACQFYPDASIPESQVHPGLYRRRDGQIDLSSIRGTGFGYRADQINRPLPAATPT